MCNCSVRCEECKVKQLNTNLENVNKELEKLDTQYMNVRKDLLNFKDLTNKELERLTKEEESKDDKSKAE